jgi:hypothetical protein
MMGVVGSEEEYITLSPTDDDGQAATPPDELPESLGRFISDTSTPPAAEPKPTVIVENIEDTLTIDFPAATRKPLSDFIAIDTKSMTWAKGQVTVMAGWLTLADKLDWLTDNRAYLEKLKAGDPKAYAYLIVNVTSREKELTNAQ